MLLWFVAQRLSPMDVDISSPKRAEILRECGLTAVAGDCRAIMRCNNPGPEGAIGTVLTFTDTDMPAETQLQVGYWPEKQEWFKCAGGRYWCGKLRGEDVDPSTLERRDGVPSIPVRLGDGFFWNVAKARYYDGETRLPRRLVLEDGKGRRGPVLDRFAALDEAAGAFWREWMSAIDEERNAEYEIDALMQLAVLGLQPNYRIGMDEAVNVLGLLDETNVWEACQATISWPTIKAMGEALAGAQKKNE